MFSVDPCPFCGEELTPVYNRERTEVVAWQHPNLKEMWEEYGSDWWCFMHGHTIGVKLIKYWNGSAATMAATTTAPPPPPPVRKAALHYEIVDSLPVFNEFGQGNPADAAFLNACFDYLRENNPWSLKNEATKS